MRNGMLIVLWKFWRRLKQFLVKLFGQVASSSHYPAPNKASAKSTGYRRPPKPDWVRKEVIRLKALMRDDGCRTVALTFNKLYGIKRQMTVGKTYVCNTIQCHQYEVQVLRQKLKHRIPRPLPRNIIWSLDLTQVRDTDHNPHTVFGVLDNGPRACLNLKAIADKASITLFRLLLDTIEAYGKPKAVRTDNEAVLVSRLFRFGLWILGIRHQRTEKHCPWMNGRIERFFGTFKAKLAGFDLSPACLQQELDVFRCWYNHVRPHQHLGGQTPAEVWNGQQPNGKGKAFRFSAWNGHLAGYYVPPG